MELYYCTVTRELLTLETLRLEYNKFYDGEMSFCDFFDMITDMGGDVRPVDPEAMMYRPDDNTVEDIDLIDESDMENYAHIADYFCNKER